MNTNNNRPFIIRRRRISFFGTWLIIGIIMMLLNATVWPEVSTSDSTRWFYDVATLWVSTLNRIFEMLLPYLKVVADWVVNGVESLINWISSNWPAIINVGKSIVTWSFRIWAYALIYLTIGFLFALLCLVVMSFTDKESAKEAWEELKQIVRDEFRKIGRIFKDPENKDDEVPANANPTSGSAGGNDN